MVDENIRRKLKRIWCGRLIMGLVATTALGFIGLQAPKVYSQAQEAWVQEQVLKHEHELEQVLKQLQVQAPTSLQLQVLKQLQLQAPTRLLVHEQAPTRLLVVRVLEQDLTQKQNKQLMQDAIFLGLAATVFISALILLSKQRNKVSLTLTGQLILFIPEECVAELGALHEQLKSEQYSVWLIRGIMLWNIWALLWAFYVQINLENVRLPQNQGRKKIDD